MFLGGMFDIASFTWSLADAKETQGSKVRKKAVFPFKQIRLGLKKTGADKVLATQEEQRQQTQSLEETVKDLYAKLKQFQSEVDSMTLEKDEALEKIQIDSADRKKESEEAAPGDAAASGSANAAAELDCVSTVSNYHDARDDDDRRSVRSGRINDSKSGRKKEFPTPALQLFYRLDELLGRGEEAAKAAVSLASYSRVTKEELQGEYGRDERAHKGD